MSAAWVAPLRALPAVATVMLIYGGLDALDLLFSPWGRAAGGDPEGGTRLRRRVGPVVCGAWRPGSRNGAWCRCRHAARRIARLLSAMTAVYALDGALTEVGRAFFVPLALSVVQSFVASTAFAGLLIGLLLTPFAPQGVPAAGYSRTRRAGSSCRCG